jgi:hypothetical protein
MHDNFELRQTNSWALRGENGDELSPCAVGVPVEHYVRLQCAHRCVVIQRVISLNHPSLLYPLSPAMGNKILVRLVNPKES